MSYPAIDFVITARPSWARVKSVISSYSNLVGASFIRIILVGPALSRRYGDISQEIPPEIQTFHFHTLHESDDLSAVAATAIRSGQCLNQLWTESKPDAVFVVADRTETLAITLTASIMQIPVVHLQGGEISGSIDDKIRDANSKLADLHFTSNEITFKRLLSLGEDKAHIQIVGCPSIDIVRQVLDSESELRNLDFEKLGVGSLVDKNRNYGIIMYHPDTLNNKVNLSWVESLCEMTRESNWNWIWFWPNPDYGSDVISKKLRATREKGNLRNILFVVNLSPEKFVILAKYSKIIIGNSSFGIRESSYLGLPSITVGERQRGRDIADNVERIIDLIPGIELWRKAQALSDRQFPSNNLYGNGYTGELIAQYLASWKPQVKKRGFQSIIV